MRWLKSPGISLCGNDWNNQHIQISDGHPNSYWEPTQQQGRQDTALEGTFVCGSNDAVRRSHIRSTTNVINIHILQLKLHGRSTTTIQEREVRIA
jgi:hypothetical protein